jgi:hypothetical protein
METKDQGIRTPEDNGSNNGQPRPSSSQGLGNSCEDDENEFESVHAFTTDDISKDTESNLTNNSTKMLIRNCQIG